MNDIVELVSALVSWPAFAIVSAVLYRREIGSALQRLRSFKISDRLEGQLAASHPSAIPGKRDPRIRLRTRSKLRGRSTR